MVPTRKVLGEELSGLSAWRTFTRIAYLVGLAGMLAVLPLFNVGMSIAGFVIAGAWLVDLVIDLVTKRTSDKFQRVVRNPSALWILALFGLHLVGLIWTTDFDYALRDLRIKLPLLYLPIVIAGMLPVAPQQVRLGLRFFLLGVGVSTFTCAWVYWGWVGDGVDDVRLITTAFFARISHIRLSLMVSLAMALLAFGAFEKPRWAWLYLCGLVWLLYFLWILQSVTGIGIAGCLCGFFVARKAMRATRTRTRRFALGSLSLLFLAATVFVGRSAMEYFRLAPSASKPLAERSPDGEAYFHNRDNRQIENGHYVWRNIAWQELETEWNTRSDLEFAGKDRRGQELKATLIRYMTSLGLAKDKSGVQALTPDDIARVEDGLASVRELEHSGIRQRLDRLFLEIDIYRNGGNPSGNSLTQRIVFWKAGLSIARTNPLIGVGTGDVSKAYAVQYAAMGMPLNEGHRLRAHNQYLTFAITFGLPGLLVFVLSLAWPGRISGAWKHPVYLAFMIVACLSFLTEDTLETQAGATFFAFFQSLFVLGTDQRMTTRTKEREVPVEQSST